MEVVVFFFLHVVKMARNPGTMLSSVERAIQSCKEEQAKLNECIEVYREILFAL